MCYTHKSIHIHLVVYISVSFTVSRNECTITYSPLKNSISHPNHSSSSPPAHFRLLPQFFQKDEVGKVYECRFCSFKFCKSQPLGGHMNLKSQGCCRLWRAAGATSHLSPLATLLSNASLISSPSLFSIPLLNCYQIQRNIRRLSPPLRCPRKPTPPPPSTALAVSHTRSDCRCISSYYQELLAPAVDAPSNTNPFLQPRYIEKLSFNLIS